jgi:hypothetical protein
MVEVESTVKFSGEHRRRGIHRFRGLVTSPLDSLHRDGPGSMAKIPDHSMVLGMAEIVHYVMNSGEVVRGCVEGRERMRETGRCEVN